MTVAERAVWKQTFLECANQCVDIMIRMEGFPGDDQQLFKYPYVSFAGNDGDGYGTTECEDVNTLLEMAAEALREFAKQM